MTQNIQQKDTKEIRDILEYREIGMGLLISIEREKERERERDRKREIEREIGKVDKHCECFFPFSEGTAMRKQWLPVIGCLVVRARQANKMALIRKHLW